MPGRDLEVFEKIAKRDCGKKRDSRHLDPNGNGRLIMQDL